MEAGAEADAAQGPVEQPAEASPATEDEREITPEELELLATIGEGTTASVYLGQLRGRKVAVKEIKVLNDEVDLATVQAVQRELRVLSKVSHPHILRFIGLVEKTFPLRLVLEYCAGGSLFELLHNRWQIPLSWKQRMKVLSDTASAADYLHRFSPPIIHRDLKSLNLMLLENIPNQFVAPHIKLADFGFARVVQERAMTQGVGTKHWMAPEVLNGTTYTEKADIFSFAMITYEVICRYVPFERLDPTSVARKISQGIRPDMEDNSIVPKEVPSGLIELLKEMWDQDPKMRPSFSEILQRVQAIDIATGEGLSL